MTPKNVARFLLAWQLEKEIVTPLILLLLSQK
jgi:hypothetical protein